MTTGPHETAFPGNPDAEDADEAAAGRDDGMVEQENELARGGHDDRQVNPNDEVGPTAEDVPTRDVDDGQA